MECGRWFHSFCDAFSTKEGGKKRNPIATLLMDHDWISGKRIGFMGQAGIYPWYWGCIIPFPVGRKKIKIKNPMLTWTKALIGYSYPRAATTLGSISLYSGPLFSIIGFITRLFISTQMLYCPFWLEKYFFDQDLHYCRGMDKPQICVKKLWRHLSPAFERLSLIIHLLKLPTRFWNVSIFLYASCSDNTILPGQALGAGTTAWFWKKSCTFSLCMALQTRGFDPLES